MTNRIAAVLLGTALAAMLGACASSGTFEQTLGSAKAEIKELDGTVEGDFSLPYTNVGFDVELEQGSVDIEIYDLLVTYDADDNEEYSPLDVIYEAKGLSSGDHKSFTDDDGNIRVSITSSDKATGTITFVEE